MSDSPPIALTPIVEAEELHERGLAEMLGSPVIVLEIGFGRADLLLELARVRPEQRYLGVEVSRKRVEKASRRVQRKGLQNIRLLRAPAEFALDRVLPERCVAECWINCPDPWPKKRHHKRRLVNPAFLERLARVMLGGAVLHLSTDHVGYRDQIDTMLRSAMGFENLNEPAAWASKKPQRPDTSYEIEWLAEGRTIAYFDYRRNEAGTCG